MWYVFTGVNDNWWKQYRLLIHNNSWVPLFLGVWWGRIMWQWCVAVTTHHLPDRKIRSMLRRQWQSWLTVTSYPTLSAPSPLNSTHKVLTHQWSNILIKRTDKIQQLYNNLTSSELWEEINLPIQESSGMTTVYSNHINNI